MILPARYLGSKTFVAIAARALGPYGIDEKVSNGLTLALLPFPADVDRELIAIKELVKRSAWFAVYDIVEATSRYLDAQDERPGIPVEGSPRRPHYEDELNTYFVRAAIVWQIVNREVVRCGEEAFETAAKTAQTELNEAGRPTAAVASMTLCRRSQGDQSPTQRERYPTP